MTRVAWLLLVLALGTPASRGDEPADLLLVRGRVLTLDPAKPLASAVAIRGDRLLAVGGRDEVEAYRGPDTRIVDLEGRLTVPGFIEGHGHFLSFGRSQMILDLSTAETWQQVVAAVAAAAALRPRGQWIVGRGWHQGKWRQPPEPHVEGYPVHTALSAVTPDHPVLLTHGTGHMALANARAMATAGITADTPAIAGGEILKTPAGQPTGVLRENAMGPLYRAHELSQRDRSPQEVLDELRTAVALAGQRCLEQGVTSFQDAGSSFADVDFFEQLAARGELPVRLWVMLNENNPALAQRMADYRRIGAHQGFLTVRAVKRMADGALGTHGAWLLLPYDDLPGSVGHSTTSRAALEQTGQLCRQHGFQYCVHAIGDRANREVLNLFAELGGNELPSWRWRIEHAQHLHPDDIPRFAGLGVIASMQGVHCTSDAPFVVARLGPRRAREGAYAWRSLLDAQARVINGTDVPVERVSAIASFYASVTRQLANGVTFFPEQSMTRDEALRSYTSEAAFAAFEEDVKGTLAPGKLADIVVLSRDLLTVPETEILDTQVDLTILGGRVVYQRRRSP